MSSPLQNHLEQRLAELTRRREALSGLQRDLSAVKTTVTSKSRAIAVTVDSRGELTEIDFKTRAYRTMAPAELSRLIVDTLAEARRDALRALTDRISPVMPDVPMPDTLGGPIDFEAMMRRVLRVTDTGADDE